MATQKYIWKSKDEAGKYIDEKIEELKRQLNAPPPSPTTNTQVEDIWKSKDEAGRYIDEQIENLQRQFREEEKEKEKKKSVEHFSREEKRLLSKIESKLSVIQFLSNSLESAEKDLKDLEEQLEVIRDCKNM